MYPFERFSETAKHVLTLAQKEAERAGHSYIGTEHLLIALIEKEDALAGAALKSLGIQIADVRTAIATVLGASEAQVVSQIIPTSRVKRVIELAFEEAQLEKSSSVDSGDLLIALAVEGEGIAAQVLRDRGVTAARLKTEIGSLRAAGMAESPSAPKRSTLNRQHLDAVDQQGKAISIDILFPPDYSHQECEDLIARVRDAVQTRLH
jgi:ATP-dependent Clp protease ATP-binding subunit ClpC